MVDENVLVQIFLVIISATTALIIWRKMSESNKITKESNEELRKSNELITLELKQKFEPRFGITEEGIQYQTDKITADFKCKISNIGNVTINDFVIYSKVENKKPTLSELIEKEDEIKIEDMKEYVGTFPPQNEMRNFRVTFKEPNHEDIFIILWFEFELLHVKEEMVFIHSFKNLGSKGYDIISNTTLQKERKLS